MKANRRAIADDAGITDVLGSILLVAITVAMMVGLAFVVLTIDGPTDTAHAELRFQALPGAGGWGTGDETVRLTHAGGEALEAGSMQIVIAVETSVTTFGPADMDQGFADGMLVIGETWFRTFTIQENDTVKATAVYDATSLLTLTTVRSPTTTASCALDVSPPTVQMWQQSPFDITTLTTGDVTVTVSLTDDCAGPDDSVPPTIEYRVGADAWAQTGAMTLIGGSQWTGNIPDQSWSTRSGETLEYRIVGMSDIRGNVGQSTLRTDLIALVDPTQYVIGFSANAGSVTDFSNAQSASDSGASTILMESDGLTQLLASSASGNGATNPGNADGSPDDVRTLLGGFGNSVTTSGFDVSGLTGTIVKVEMVWEGHYQGVYTNDAIDLLAKSGGGFVTVLNNHVPPLLIDGQTRVDITGIRGSWTWTDVSVVELQSKFDKVNSEDPIDFLVDSMFLEVTTAEVNDLDIEFEWPTLVAGTTHTLEIMYSVTADTFIVEVWDGTAWNARGATLGSSSMIAWSYNLSAAEASGQPKIRFVDNSGVPPPGTLTIDYARVVTT